MEFIADLHIHSRYSRATARSLDPENLSLWAQKKGIKVIGTGDLTHPLWIKELQKKLVPAEDGLFRLKPEYKKNAGLSVPGSCISSTRFMLTGEISCIYKKNGKTRKVHHLVLMPDMDSVLEFNRRLRRIGNIESDGRPILGLDSRNLLELTLEVTDKSFFIPAHIWTPWFSVFGSKSGFDCLEECFDDLTCHVHALETGLSSDPPMNRYVSSLDNYILVSNSDAHSPSKLGREANIFNTGLTYTDMINAMTDGEGFSGTIEFYPEEGKYHMDGHRKCGVMIDPLTTIVPDNICPVCKKPLTIGVLNRVHELRDRESPIITRKYVNLIPLVEILSELLACGPSSNKVTDAYEKLLNKLGPELKILMDVPLERIKEAGGPLLEEAISRLRKDHVIKEGGYDGEFGVIRLFDALEKQEAKGQMGLFEEQKPKKIKTSIKTMRPVKDTPALKKEIEKIVSDSILDPLNPDQKNAVLHDREHVLVTAGPGTGKTRTLAHAIARLIRDNNVHPENILAITFTRKAANEIKERINSITGNKRDGVVQVSTFHGLCNEILRKESEFANLKKDFCLLSEKESIAVIMDMLSGEDSTAVRKFIKLLPGIRAEYVLKNEKEPDEENIKGFFIKYSDGLKSQNLVDLDGLEFETLNLFRKNPDVREKWADRYSWIFVDEYQDTSPVQVELLKCLVRQDKTKIFAIGDPDQAIYGFRGADIRNFFRFRDDFDGASNISLTRNYRSVASILKGAAALLGKESPLLGDHAGNDLIETGTCSTDSEEAEMIVEQIEKLLGGTTHFSIDSGRVETHEGNNSYGFGDIAVLYRLNAQGDFIETAFKRAGMPFVRSGEIPLAERFPVNIIYACMKHLHYPENPSLKRIYETTVKSGNVIFDNNTVTEINASDISGCIDQIILNHGIHDMSDDAMDNLKRLKELAVSFGNDIRSFLGSLSLERGIDHASLAGDRISLMTLHAAKGLEWPVVFIAGCDDGLIPCSLFGDTDAEEEKRLFYVGMTRARTKLILSHTRRRTLNGRTREMPPSPFIDAIPKDSISLLVRKKWRPKRAYEQLTLF